MQWLIVQFKQQRRFGGRRLSWLDHAFIVTACLTSLVQKKCSNLALRFRLPRTPSGHWQPWQFLSKITDGLGSRWVHDAQVRMLGISFLCLLSITQDEATSHFPQGRNIRRMAMLQPHYLREFQAQYHRSFADRRPSQRGCALEGSQPGRACA